MRTFVKFDKEGNILSTCRLEFVPEGAEHPYEDLAEGESVIEIPSTEAVEGISCAEIHAKYKVDPGRKRLVLQQQADNKETEKQSKKKS